MSASTPIIAQIMGLSIEAWIGMIIAIISFWVVAGTALIKTLQQDEEKMAMLDRQDRIETYSPKALQDLRDWIESNPNDPLIDRAKMEYNQCVETLKEEDEQFYDWTAEQIENLEKL